MSAWKDTPFVVGVVALRVAAPGGGKVMVAEVFAGLSAFKTLFDTARSLKDMNDAVVRSAAVIEMQEQILSACCKARNVPKARPI